MTALMVLALVLLVQGGAYAHSYHMGKCPKVPPMEDFVTSKFLGRWHVLQKTSTRVRCLSNEFSWMDEGKKQQQEVEDVEEGGEWEEERRTARGGAQLVLLQRMQLPLPALNNGVRYTGSLRADPDPHQAALFTARFPLNMLGAASYVVFDTDYSSYAGVVSCQQVALWYRLSASIMARGRSLSTDVLHKLRRQLTAFGVDVRDLNEIRQTCEDADEEKGVQLHIKPNVLRTNATSILEDTKDVVATAAEAARRAVHVYNTVNGIYSEAAASTRRRRRRRDIGPASSTTPGLIDWMP